MPSTYTYKKFKDKNGNIAYHQVNYVKFENRESVEPETFKGKYFTKVAVGKWKNIYSKKTFDEEGNYIEPTQEVTVFDSFEYRKSFAYSKVKKTSQIAKIENKSKNDKKIYFVTINHSYKVGNEVILQENQNLVFINKDYKSNRKILFQKEKKYLLLLTRNFSFNKSFN